MTALPPSRWRFGELQGFHSGNAARALPLSSQRPSSMSQPPMSQHHGARKPAQKRRMGSGGRRETTARRAAEKDGRESLLPKESSPVQRRQMNVSDGPPLPPDVGVRLRGRGRAGGAPPELLLPLLLMPTPPLSLPLLLPSPE
jgi:hypothetical protein